MRLNNPGVDGNSRISEVVVVVTGVALLFLLLYIIVPVLSPFVLAAAILFLLYPVRRLPYIRRLLWLVAFFLIAWFLYSAAGVLTPFVIALLLAYVLNPLVTVLEKRRIRRWTSSLLLMLLFVALIVGSVILVVPIAVAQFSGLIESISALARDGKIQDLLARSGIPIQQIQDLLEKQFPAKLEGILTSLLEGAFGLVTGLSSILAEVLNLIIIPFVTFYLLKDFPRILEGIKSFIPEGPRGRIGTYVLKIDEVLGEYFRGAIVVAIIQGIISAVVLSLLGVQYALVLGIMTAFLDFIPYVGLLISLLVSCIVALLGAEPTTMRVVGVAIMYVALKLFENTVLAPKIIGSKVGVHPVLMILALFIFGHFLGFVGLLIAIPTTAVIMQFFNAWVENVSSKTTPVGESE
jgi:predicted PurR-regulated permease PerM